MKCEDCLVLLDEYIEDELKGQNSAGIPEHIEACTTCAAYYEVLLREQEVYERYFLEAEVTPAFWKNLQAEIKEVEVSRVSSYSALLRRWLGEIFSNVRFEFAGRAALVSLGLAVACILIISILRTKFSTIERVETYRMNSGSLETRKGSDNSPAIELDTKHNSPQISQTLPVPTMSPTVRSAVNTTRPRRVASGYSLRNSDAPLRDVIVDEPLLPGEQSYVQTIDQLSSEVEPVVAKMPTSLRTEYQHNIKTVDRAIAEARLAARRHPMNPVMADFVMSAYQGKLTLLTSMAKIPMPSAPGF